MKNNDFRFSLIRVAFLAFSLIFFSCQDINDLLKSRDPSITVDLAVVSFGQASAAGLQVEQQLTLSNEGREALVISKIEISTTDFSRDEVILPLQILSGENFTFNLYHTTREGGTSTAILFLFTNDPESPVVEIPLVSEGVPTVVEPAEPDALKITLSGSSLTTEVQPVWNWSLSGQGRSGLTEFLLTLESSDSNPPRYEMVQTVALGSDKRSWTPDVALNSVYNRVRVTAIMADTSTKDSNDFETVIDRVAPLLGINGDNPIMFPADRDFTTAVDDSQAYHDVYGRDLVDGSISSSDISYELFRVGSDGVAETIAQSDKYLPQSRLSAGESWEFVYSCSDRAGNAAVPIRRRITAVAAANIPDDPSGVQLLRGIHPITDGDRHWLARPGFRWSQPVSGNPAQATVNGYQYRVIPSYGGAAVFDWQEVSAKPDGTAMSVTAPVDIRVGHWIFEVRSFVTSNSDRYYSYPPIQLPFETVSKVYVDMNASVSPSQVPDSIANAWSPADWDSSIKPAPGITIVFSGTSSQPLTGLFSGTPGHPITLQGDGTMIWRHPLNLNGSYLIVEDMVFDSVPAGAAALSSAGNTHFRAQRLHFTGSDHALKFDDSRYVHLEHLVFSNCRLGLSLNNSREIRWERSYSTGSQSLLSSISSQLIWVNHVSLDDILSASSTLIQISDSASPTASAVNILNNTFFWIASPYDGTLINDSCSTTRFENNLIDSRFDLPASGMTEMTPMPRNIQFQIAGSHRRNLLGPDFCGRANSTLNPADFTEDLLIDSEFTLPVNVMDELAKNGATPVVLSHVLTPFLKKMKIQDHSAPAPDLSGKKLPDQSLRDEIAALFTPGYHHPALHGASYDSLVRDDFTEAPRTGGGNSTPDIGAFERTAFSDGHLISNPDFDEVLDSDGTFYRGEVSEDGNNWSSFGGFGELVPGNGPVPVELIARKRKVPLLVSAPWQVHHDMRSLRNVMAVQPVFLDGGETYQLDMHYIMTAKTTVVGGLLVPDPVAGGFKSELLLKLPLTHDSLDLSKASGDTVSGQASPAFSSIAWYFYFLPDATGASGTGNEIDSRMILESNHLVRK